MKILLVEDDANDVTMIKRVLNGLDLTCVGCLGDLPEQQDFDVIITDLNIPDSHGVETVSRLREAFPHAAIVVISGSTTPELSEECIEAGANDLVNKDTITRRNRSVLVDILETATKYAFFFLSAPRAF